nr:ubiquitin-like small modifier protein 1 [Halorarius litoreus]
MGLTETSVRVKGIGEGTATIRDALHALLEAYPELRAEVLTDEDELADYVHVVHNHVDIYNETHHLATPVAVGDDLALFPRVE